GAAGVDELSLEGPSRVCELRDGWVRKYWLRPGDVGVDEAPLRAVVGGDAAHNAAAIEAVLAGEAGPAREFVVLNAGAAILVGGGAEDLAAGVASARQALDSGRAQAVLTAWRAFA
ncbi:MAG: anthranilate phosphoribosyltransferase, partial [Armatimonadetes bacterium]|nr:anthranilate phosphoribosyltransferase [Armatimonadota bacterium]